MTTALFSRAHLGLFAAIAAITSVGAGSMLTYPLLALLMERAGENATMVGVNAAAATIGIITAGPLLGPIMARAGAAPVMLGCVGVVIACLAAFGLGYDFYAWFAIRLAMGLAIGGLYLASEYWILAQAPPKARGRWVAAYALALSVGYALGPTILRIIGTEGFTPFLAAILICALSGGIVWAARRMAPAIDHDPGGSPWPFFRSDLTLIAAVALFGMIEFGAMGLITIWGVKLGYTEADAIEFTIILAFGGMAITPLFGWAADHFPARALLVIIAAISVATALILPAISNHQYAVWTAFFIWGGSAAALYIVALSEMGARYENQPNALAGGNAAIVTAYGLGAMIGPPLVGQSIDFAGPDGLPASFGVLSAIFIALALSRRLIRLFDSR